MGWRDLPQDAPGVGEAAQHTATNSSEHGRVVAQGLRVCLQPLSSEGPQISDGHLRLKRAESGFGAPDLHTVGGMGRRNRSLA